MRDAQPDAQRRAHLAAVSRVDDAQSLAGVQLVAKARVHTTGPQGPPQARQPQGDVLHAVASAWTRASSVTISEGVIAARSWRSFSRQPRVWPTISGSRPSRRSMTSARVQSSVSAT